MRLEFAPLIIQTSFCTSKKFFLSLCNSVLKKVNQIPLECAFRKDDDLLWGRTNKLMCLRSVFSFWGHAFQVVSKVSSCRDSFNNSRITLENLIIPWNYLHLQFSLVTSWVDDLIVGSPLKELMSNLFQKQRKERSNGSSLLAPLPLCDLNRRIQWLD